MGKIYLCLIGRIRFCIKFILGVVLMGVVGVVMGQVNGDYRSSTAGTWLGILPTATWDQYNGGIWTPTSLQPASSTTNTVYILHAISANGPFGNTINLVIESGGTFTITASSSTASILVNNGGILQINAALTNGGNFAIENGGRTNLNHSNTHGNSTLWNGTENFKSGSIFEIQNWNYTAVSNDKRLIQNPSIISVNTTGGYFFGNLIISGSPTTEVFVMSAGTQSINLTENNFTNSTTVGSQNVVFTNAASNITIGGNLIVTSAQFSFAATNSGSPVATILGDITPTGGTIDLNQTSAAAATPIIQLKGNLNVPFGATLRSGDAGCKIVFSGNTKQSISIAGSLLTNVDFEIAAASTVKLVNQNLALSYTANNFDVLAFGTLDFNGYDITGLGAFYQASTASLKITSPLGVNPSGNNTGNVQNTGSRSFSQSGHFYFTGNSNPQSTGLAITSGSTAKRIFIEKTNSSDVVNLSQTTGTTEMLTITTGNFVETANAFVYGSGVLNMAKDGTYKISVLSSTLPQLTGTPYNLTGGSVIELNGAGSQILRGAQNYRNLTFSGSTSSTLGSNPSSIRGTVYITGSAMLDIGSSNVFGDSTTNLTMDGGRFKMSGTTTDKPDIDGTYNLRGGVIEFAGSSIGAQPIKGQTSRGTANIVYKNIEVTGTNVGTGSYNIYLNKTVGNFTVKSPNAVYAPNTKSIISENGINTSTITIESGAAFKIGNNQGFSGTTYSVPSNSAIDNNISGSKIFLNQGSTVDYAGASAQTISNKIPYQNLAISATTAVNKTAPGSDGGDLIILGNITKASGSTFVANGGAVSLEGTLVQIYSGTESMEFYNLVNKNTIGGFTVSSDFGVVNQLKLNSSSKLTFGSGNINLRSSATQTCYVPDLGTTNMPTIDYAGTGRFQIERYLTSIKSWRLLATPIQSSTLSITNAWREGGTALTSTGYGTQITGPATSLGMDTVTVRGSMKWYSKASNNYVEITNTADAIARPQGYYVFVRGDRAQSISGTGSATNLRMRGKILTGDQTFSTLTATSPTNGFESVGNPYASQINYKTVTKSNLESSFTVWNPTAGAYGVGRFIQYVSITGLNGDYSNGETTTVNTIESGQAFFIQSAVGVSGSITIKESDKLAGSNLVSRNESEGRHGINVPTLEINLHDAVSSKTQTFLDHVVLNFDSNYSNGFDGDDVRKFMNANDNLAIKKDLRNLILERRNTLTATDTIFLSLTNTRIAPYHFEIDPSVLGNLGLKAYLKDKFLQTETEVSLTDVTNVNFNITTDGASKLADRFMLVFRTAIAAGQLPGNFITIVSEKNFDKSNTIKWTYSNEFNIGQYSIELSRNGTAFTGIGNKNAANLNTTQSYTFTDAFSVTGTNSYRVKATSTTGLSQYSNIVKVVENDPKSFFSLYPNPLENKTLHINFEKMQGGYTLRLFAKQGATVFSKQINVSSAMEVKNIVLGNAVAAGIYKLVLVDSNGKKLLKTVYIN